MTKFSIQTLKSSTASEVIWKLTRNALFLKAHFLLLMYELGSLALRNQCCFYTIFIFPHTSLIDSIPYKETKAVWFIKKKSQDAKGQEPDLSWRQSSRSLATSTKDVVVFSLPTWQMPDVNNLREMLASVLSPPWHLAQLCPSRLQHSHLSREPQLLKPRPQCDS